LVTNKSQFEVVDGRCRNVVISTERDPLCPLW
jgi:hypothetical protein